MFTPRFPLRATLAATATIALLCLAGCGSDPAPAASSSADTSAAPSSTAPSTEPSATTTATPVPSEAPASAEPTPEPTPKLDWGGPLAPGAFGAIVAKGNVRSLVKQGWMTRDTAREENCEGRHWKWAEQVGDGVDVTYDPKGDIVSFGMREPVLETAEGVTVGDSLMVLQDVYGARPQSTNDYGQTTWVVKDGNSWIGFLLSGNTRDAKIEFIEVSVGRQPGLLRDGC
ncbi:hypothetical protein [Nocardioides panzhihuensis]|uniref:Uncharacterized protein n=1 Tax=Nocardioides panzhihuensis TaxID=860243 RepID=A0A7Z0DQL2_9ACTN|nr:hypothetical protein [Nocardioides panzhihuensis]NYI79991.1 hypothetical protein [Nocardioides panzhihuensis]